MTRRRFATKATKNTKIGKYKKDRHEQENRQKNEDSKTSPLAFCLRDLRGSHVVIFVASVHTPDNVSISSLPVLPPTCSTGTSSLSISVTSRFAIVGLSAYVRCRPPLS